jgi:hypothetical protein
MKETETICWVIIATLRKARDCKQKSRLKHEKSTMVYGFQKWGKYYADNICPILGNGVINILKALAAIKRHIRRHSSTPHRSMHDK